MSDNPTGLPPELVRQMDIGGAIGHLVARAFDGNDGLRVVITMVVVAAEQSGDSPAFLREAATALLDVAGFREAEAKAGAGPRRPWPQ